ncbi:MAG: Rpn family recombination-promoting nuclease/putative transposase [Planctomycetes bacterium]|nr:Rpn family recombination-promoting nuclease/putative transposase [Planctomycetota bacterium]
MNDDVPDDLAGGDRPRPRKAQKPHDALVQRTFGRAEVARGYLCSVLPSELVAHFDLDTIERDARSYTDPDLSERLSDLVFRVKLVGGDLGAGEDASSDGDPGEALIYVLIEHQSRVDPVMAARLYVYTARALDRWLSEHSGAKRVPAVLPLLVYNGRQPWTAARSLGDLFSLSEQARRAAAGLLPELGYRVDDLRRSTDEELRGRPVSLVGRVTLIFLRHGTDTEAELLAFLRGEAGLLGDLEDRDDMIAHSNYILSVDGGETKQEVFDALKQALGPRNQEVVMTVAEQLREEGRQEGRLEGERSLLLRQLRRRFHLDAQTESRIAQAGEEALALWADRVLDAKALEDVFRPAQ